MYSLNFCESEVAQSCLTLCDPMDCSQPGSFLHGVFQARILEWVATAFSRGSSQPRDWTWVLCTAGRIFTIWTTKEAEEIFIVFEWYFTEYTVLDCQVFFFLPFSTLTMLYHFLPFILSSGKSAVIWIFVPMYKSCFFPAVFRILFLSLVLSNLIVLLLSVIFLASDAWGTFSFLELWFYIFSSNLKHFRILFLHIFFLF